MNELQDKLKKLRIKNNLTMQELADKFNEKFNTNISKSMISNWENGTFKPSLNNLSLYSQYFSISLDFFQEEKQTKEQLMKLSYKEWTHLKRDIDIYHLEKERFEVKEDAQKED